MNPDKFVLPEGLAEPLHVLPAWTAAALWGFVALLIVAALAYLIYRWYEKYARDRENRKTFSRRESGFGKRAITQLERRFIESGEIRQGCHELSARMKTHFEQKTALEIEEMTAEEMGRKLIGKPIKFFLKLSSVQFQRNKPDERQFQDLCNQARSLLRSSLKERPEKRRRLSAR